MSESSRQANSRQQSDRQASLQEAISLAHAGAYAEARTTVVALLHEHPNEPDAWFWLACVTDNPWEALASLKKVQGLAPRYPVTIESGIEWVQGKIHAGETLTPMSAPFVPAATTRERRADKAPAASIPWSRWGLGIIAIVLIVALAGGATWVLKPDNEAPAPTDTPVPTTQPTNEPTRETPAQPETTWMDAWEAEDWAGAITELEKIRDTFPSEAAWRNRLFDAHLKMGVELIGAGDLETALAEFDAARMLNPHDPELHQYRSLVTRYQVGIEQTQRGEWQSAIQTLSAVLNDYPVNLQSQAFLYELHYSLGLAHQAGGNLNEAEAEYFLASQLAHNTQEVNARLDEITRLRIPPTPIPVEKRIEVSIAEQRFYAYEDDEPVYEFVCSTGMYSSPTQPGSYEVLDKIPMAYGSTWDLDMPYWMGIYWSGTLENGIHALPILANGQLLWEGYLGQPASYGCVILSTENAETIYNWAEVGTPVIIY